MNYAEMDCATKRIAKIFNDRPLSVQISHSKTPKDNFLTPQTPNVLITGRSDSMPPKEHEYGNDDTP